MQRDRAIKPPLMLAPLPLPAAPALRTTRQAAA